MALFSGLANSLFGADKIQTQNAQQQIFNAQREAELYKARESVDYARQVQLAAYLQRTMQGGTPSVAEGQLYSGYDQAQKAANANVAGATGTNAGLARYASILGQGQDMGLVNQQAAQVRAQETALAAQNAAGLYANMGMRSAGLGTSAGTAGLDYSKLMYGQEASNMDQMNKENAAFLQAAGATASAVSGGWAETGKQAKQARGATNTSY